MKIDEPSPCSCEHPGATHTQFATSFVGQDETGGRFADVTIERCRSCCRPWLRYFVEYEAFSRSGRWARGLIGEHEAGTVAPEAAVDYLNRLDWYLYGGSYFDGASGRRTGPMHWGR